MSRAPSTFRQRDLTAAVKAMVAAGQKLTRVEVDKDGRFVLMVADADAASVKSSTPTETPEELRKLL